MRLLSQFALATNRPNYIFVMGCGHSGTSLVAIMLGAHSKIYAINYETNAFVGRKGPAEGIKAIELAAADCGKHGIDYICEKTPKHISNVDKILSAFPVARLVIAIRDPRDVVCSIKRRTTKLEEGIRRWRHDNEYVLRAIKRSNSFLVRYEELIGRPESTLSSLCTFLGLQYEVGMLNYWQDNRNWFGVAEQRETDGSEGIDHKIRRNWQIHQPLMLDRIGMFRDGLAASEVACICRELGPLASRLGYSIEEPD